MMKATLCAILACLLLSGCAAETPEPTETVPIVTEAPTEPAGSYEPGSSMELATGGGVRVYPQELGNIWKIEPVGEDLLVFSDGEVTQITRFSGENLFQAAQIRLDRHYSRFCVGEEQILCYDSEDRELLYLDRDLREIKRVAVPRDMLGEPVLTADRMRMYYCTSSGVRCLDMESGISRLVKEMTFAQQYITAIHMGDTVLQVAVSDEKGNRENLFLDAGTGALAGELPEDMRLVSSADYFYAMDPEGIVDQMIFGTAQKVWQLNPDDYLDSGIFLPEVHGAVVFDRGSDGLVLDYFDLSTGLRTASVNLGEMNASNFAADDKGHLYFVSEHGGGQSICRWDLQKTITEDDENYVTARYSFDSPDMEGLTDCRAYAERLGGQFGVEIELITEAVDLHPEGYDLVPEYQVPVIMDALTELERLLAQYPAGMFGASVEGLEDGKLRIMLVRELRGSDSADPAAGIHFWQGSHSVLVLAMGGDMESAFYRQMYHALESRLLSRSIALYRWDELNPTGFAYDCDLTETPNRNTEGYFEDDTRIFADEASMASPREDRASVMAFACMPGNEDYFLSDTMQNKLLALCEGIREAYGLEKDPQSLLWEQYLKSPLIK